MAQLQQRLNESAILKAADRGHARFLLQFGGQGTSYFEELQRIYLQQQLPLDGFFRTLYRTLEEEMASSALEKPEWYEAGMDVECWLLGDKPAPSPELLQSGLYSGPLIFATQVAHYLQFAHSCGGTEQMLPYCAATIGHSQGIHGALLASLALDGEPFLEAFSAFLRLLFWQGYRTREAFLPEYPGADIMALYQKSGAPVPSPMMSVHGLERKDLDSQLASFNRNRSRPLELALSNGWQSAIIAGDTGDLVRFRNTLIAKDPSIEERIEFLPVSAPYHSRYMAPAMDRLRQDLERLNFSLRGSQLQLPVFDATGQNLQQCDDISYLILEVSTFLPVDWPSTVMAARHSGPTHAINFGPGSSMVALSAPLLEPAGIIQLDWTNPNDIESAPAQLIRRGCPWREFAPVQAASVAGIGATERSEPFLLNRYSRFTGRPPVFGGGMTPTTSEIDMVAAAARSGRIVEWAGGGQVTEAIFMERLERLCESLEPGDSIVVNLLYLDAYLWGFQYPLVRRLSREGYPIDGITISAGIPDLDEAVSILDSLEQSGLWLNSLKPGTSSQIRQVLDIAARRPGHSLIMQVEGGAAGGHHSWENLEELIAANYHRIRRNDDVILAVGGGIATPRQAAEWLHGSWNNGESMPVDAVFLGTRLMAAAEAQTADTVKEALVRIGGQDSWMEGKNGANLGGVVSGRSGLGADIYYAKNHWSDTSAWLEKLLAGKDAASAREVIQANRTEIIDAINRTAKPYFGELDIDYATMLRRFVELTCASHLKNTDLNRGAAFIDQSYAARFAELAQRCIQRFGLTHPESDPNDPLSLIQSLIDQNSLVESTPLYPEDRQHFLQVCMRPGKPVNFIPVIDESLLRHYRSDSLWYSHCEGIDPESCAWIPGPVAVSGITIPNESVVQILTSFERAIIARSSTSSHSLAQATYQSHSDYRAQVQLDSNDHSAVRGNGDSPHPFEYSASIKPDRIASTDSQTGFFLEPLAQANGVLYDFLLSRTLYSGRRRQNGLLSLFQPRTGQRLRMQQSDAGLSWLGLYTDHRNGSTHLELELKLEGSEVVFCKHSSDPQPSGAAAYFEMRFHDTGRAVGRFVRSTDPVLDSQGYYARIWGSSGKSEGYCLESSPVESFLQATRIRSQDSLSPAFAIVPAWESLVEILLKPELNGNLLQLVHLFHEFQWKDAYNKLVPGQRLRTRTLLERQDNRNGKTFVVRGEIIGESKDASAEELPGEETVATFRSGFFIRDSKGGQGSSECLAESIFLQTNSPARCAFLEEQPWIHFKEPPRGPEPLELRPDPDQYNIQSSKGGRSVQFRGVVLQRRRVIGDVNLDWEGEGTSPLEALAEKMGLPGSEKSVQRRRLFGERDRAPLSMHDYAKASGDTNPIHTDPFFAQLAGFDGPIVHGMWTAARVVDAIVRNVCQGDSTLLVSLDSQFLAPLKPGETFFISAYHTANDSGERFLEVSATTLRGEQIYAGTARVRSPKTAYVFTGQGSQSQNMGMKFYEEHAAARKIWDEAEETTRNLGFSIIDIVRNNPSRIVVDRTIYKHPSGVLHLTQFTQVGLVCKAMADRAVLAEQGLLVEDAYFAGHSLGEYAALASQGILPLDAVIRIVYHRGLTMQSLVPRNEAGESPYGMTVVLGNRKAGLTEARISELVNEVQKETDLSLEIVNYNIRDRQYSVTGHRPALDALESLLKKISSGHKTFIRIPGIDVPFHSRILLPGVDAFRQVLIKNLLSVRGLYILENRYVPNLVARPFSTDEEFRKTVIEATNSAVLKKFRPNRSNLEEYRKCLLIELLAYQFAMPVRWIETQEFLFQEAGVRRFIDIGARGDLAGMARQTLRSLQVEGVSVLHVEENADQVFYRGDDAPDARELFEKTKDPQSSVQVQATPESVDASPTAEAESVNLPSTQPISRAGKTSSAPAASIPDARPGVSQALQAVLAHKSERRMDEILDTDTIEDLFGGNSSRRNQALADLGAEFNSTELDGAQDQKIGDLVARIEKSTDYSGPGPYLRTLFEGFIQEWMPRGFGRQEIMDHAKQKRQMPDGHVLALTMELPLLARAGSSNGEGPLGAEPIEKRLTPAEAPAWLDRSIDAYGSRHGISFPYPGSGEDSQTMQIDASALADLEARYFGIDGILPHLLRLGRKALTGEDPFGPLLVRDRESLEIQGRANLPLDERGKACEDVMAPRFDGRKIVHFSNAYQWIRRNLYNEFWEILNKEKQTFSPGVLHQLASLGPEMESMISYMERKAATRRPALAKTLSEIRVRLQGSSGIGDSEMPALLENPWDLIDGPYKSELQMGEDGSIDTIERTDSNFVDSLTRWFSGNDSRKPYCSFLRSEDDGNHFEAAQEETASFLVFMRDWPRENHRLKDRIILVTGAGPGSIASEIVGHLLSCGSTVVVTTSSFGNARQDYFKDLFQKKAVAAARLLLVPFSQGSLRDVDSLLHFLVEEDLIPDAIIPFAAIGDESDLASVGADSAAGLRVHLIGVQALIGRLANHYRDRYLKHRFRVILPLSPNHGTFGRDGLYAEAKLALEATLRKWHSEQDEWGAYCQLIGCRIGWVRGTGLMELNDMVAPGLEESAQIKTFHRSEMALLLCGTLAFDFDSIQPVLADFSGGLGGLRGLRESVQQVRRKLLQDSKYYRELYALRNGNEPINSAKSDDLLSSTLDRFTLPSLEAGTRHSSVPVPLESLVCVVGYGEVGPGGSSRTRWDLERNTDLSLESIVELAWTMGFIEFKNGQWVDRSNGESLSVTGIRDRYQKRILEGTGIRVVNPEVCGFDPRKRPVLSEVVLEEDFYVPVSSEEEGREYCNALPDETDLYHNSEKQQWFIRRRAGSTIRMLKSVALERYVAGQIPDGWDAERLGIPRDLVRQVDRVTLFNLVATAEAFLAAGMEPEELYEYLHPSMVGSTVGGGLGGTSRLASVFTDQLLDRKRQNDALQETLINVTAAYAITSYVGSTGPIQTPVAACATGGVSLDMAMNLIRAGKARFVMAGGFDEISGEGMMGFGDMQATAETATMIDRGIDPGRMSRPNDARRGGFVESHGGGTVLLARGDLALQMGLPVYGILAATATHSDGIHPSIPAPGQGLLSVAAESGPEDRKQREGLPATRLQNLNQALSILETSESAFAAMGSPGRQMFAELRSHLFTAYIPDDGSVSHLRRGLEIHGMHADDIGVIYKHDTSTEANDVNENRLHNAIQEALGRSPGNPAIVVSQKSYTGHSKAGAASWQLIGLIQCLQEGIVPPNRNLQDVDGRMNEFKHLVFTDKPLQCGRGEIRAGLISTLGFGHVGALALVIHGNEFLKYIPPEILDSYLQKRKERMLQYQYRVHAMRLPDEAPLFRRRTDKPITDEAEERRMLLDSSARLKRG